MVIGRLGIHFFRMLPGIVGNEPLDEAFVAKSFENKNILFLKGLEASEEGKFMEMLRQFEDQDPVFIRQRRHHGFALNFIAFNDKSLHTPENKQKDDHETDEF